MAEQREHAGRGQVEVVLERDDDADLWRRARRERALASARCRTASGIVGGLGVDASV